MGHSGSRQRSPRRAGRLGRSPLFNGRRAVRIRTTAVELVILKPNLPKSSRRRVSYFLNLYYFLCWEFNDLKFETFAAYRSPPPVQHDITKSKILVWSLLRVWAGVHSHSLFCHPASIDTLSSPPPLRWLSGFMLPPEGEDGAKKQLCGRGWARRTSFVGGRPLQLIWPQYEFAVDHVVIRPPSPCFLSFFLSTALLII